MCSPQDSCTDRSVSSPCTAPNPAGKSCTQRQLAHVPHLGRGGVLRPQCGSCCQASELSDHWLTYLLQQVGHSESTARVSAAAQLLVCSRPGRWQGTHLGCSAGELWAVSIPLADGRVVKHAGDPVGGLFRGAAVLRLLKVPLREA